VHEPRKATPAEQLSALARAARAINENLELSPLLTAICAEARAISKADTAAVYLTDAQGGVVAEAGDGLTVDGIGYRLELGQGLAGRVAQEGRSLVAEDYQELAQPAPGSPVADVRSAMAVPMRWDGALRGVLSVGFHRAHPIDPDDLRLLETFGELAAAACRNANATAGLALAARTDALTGCLNHAALHDGLRLEIERCARTDQPLSLVLFDLDEFKQVNERHGHLVGDEVLRRVGHALRSAVRPYDLCARHGGDEFAIVCSNAGEDDAAEVAGRAMQRLAEALADVPEAVGTGATAGVAAWHEGQSGTSLLEDADRALLYGKQQGHRREIVHASSLPETFRPLRFRRDAQAQGPEGGPDAQARRQAERLQKRSRQLLLASALGARLAGMREPAAIVEAAIDELRRAFGYYRCAVVRAADAPTTGVIARALLEGRAVTVGEDERSQLAAPIRVGAAQWGAIGVEEARRGAFDDEDVRLVQIVADQLGAALHSAELYEQLERAYLGTAHALSAALDARDAGAPRSNGSIAELCEAVGRRLGMDVETLHELRYGAALHDIGKIAVPEAILDKPGELERDEREVLEGHPLVGERIVQPLHPLADVSPLIRHEHERWDGTGYPDRLAGSDIPLGARVIFACDAYQAMVSDRPFRPALPPDQAREELRRNAGSQFDPAVVEALLAVLGEH
jgi:diguanylate cyclase (GGDEF)-like protein